MNKNKGVTLVELLVAVVIFSIFALGSLAFFGFGKKRSLKSPQVDYAMQLAEDQVELLRTMAYDAVTGSTGNDSFTKYGTTFNRWYATSEFYTYEEVYQVVTISVTWTVDGQQKNVSLYSVITEED